jgi:hypothetical protein
VGRALVKLLVLVIVVFCLGGTAGAAAAPSKPDAHDRAIAQRLAAEVIALRKLATAADGGDERITKALEGCTGLGKTPGESFAVVFAMLPVLLIDVVNEIRPLLLRARTSIDALDPHAALFKRWLAALRVNLDLMLALDNPGKKIDYCAAAKTLLAKNATDAQITAVLGVSQARIKALFSKQAAQAGSTVKKLNPQMRVFLIAAGVPRGIAVQLTK